MSLEKEPAPAIESLRLAQGLGSFADDLWPADLLHAKVLRSPHPHARIRRIDCSAARSLTGVATVLSCADLPPLVGAAAHPEWILDETVRYVGDRVAVVAAEDPEVAWRACQSIEVDYEVLPAVFDPEQATETLAALDIETGDVVHAEQQADHVCAANFRFPGTGLPVIEPQVAITSLDEDRRLVVRSSSWTPFRLRKRLAAVLGLPMARIRVTSGLIGVEPGARPLAVVEDLCALLTLATRRPVRLAHTGDEELRAVRAGGNQVVELRLALGQGRLTALDVRWLAEAGAFGSASDLLLRQIAREILTVYRIANVRFRGQVVATNLAPTGFARGETHSYAALALERQMEAAALRLDEDPVAFRERHLAHDDEALAGLGALACVGGAVAPLTRGRNSCRAALRRLTSSPPMASEPGHTGQGHVVLGTANAIAYRPSPEAGQPCASIALTRNPDGSFLLAAAPNNPLVRTCLRGWLAEAWGLSCTAIAWLPTDTDTVPFDPEVTSSSAVLLSAVEQAKHDLEAAAPAGAAQAQTALLTFAPSLLSVDGAAVQAGVSVDLETGLVTVERILIAAEVDQRLTPEVTRSRIESAALQGVSLALSEGWLAAGDAGPPTQSLRDYGRPRFGEPLPATLLLSTARDELFRDPTSAVRAAVAAAIVNAVARALKKSVSSLPLTPERILGLLG